MQNTVGTLFIAFGVLEFVGAFEFPDTIQALVLLAPPMWVSWSYFPVGALLAIIFGTLVFLTRLVGLCGVFAISLAYVGLHGAAVTQLGWLEYGLVQSIIHMSWFDARALGSFGVWLAVAVGTGRLVWTRVARGSAHASG